MEPLGNSHQLCDLIDKVACSFRIGFEAQANDLLSDFSQEIDSFLLELPIEKLNYVNACLTLILEAQTRRDSIFIADIIEHEIKPLIK